MLVAQARRALDRAVLVDVGATDERVRGEVAAHHVRVAEVVRADDAGTGAFGDGERLPVPAGMEAEVVRAEQAERLVGQVEGAVDLHGPVAAPGPPRHHDHLLAGLEAGADLRPVAVRADEVDGGVGTGTGKRAGERLGAPRPVQHRDEDGDLAHACACPIAATAGLSLPSERRIPNCE